MRKSCAKTWELAVEMPRREHYLCTKSYAACHGRSGQPLLFPRFAHILLAIFSQAKAYLNHLLVDAFSPSSTGPITITTNIFN